MEKFVKRAPHTEGHNVPQENIATSRHEERQWVSMLSGEHNEELLKDFGEQYKQILSDLNELELNLHRSIADAAAEQAKDPARAKLITLVGRAIKQEIDEKMETKAKLEKEMKTLGGNPKDFEGRDASSDFILQ